MFTVMGEIETRMLASFEIMVAMVVSAMMVVKQVIQ